MTDVRFPAHRLCYLGEGTNVLLAVVGTSIQSLRLSDGQCLSVWPRDEGEESDVENDIDDRPSKKLKLENGKNSSSRRRGSEGSDGSIHIKTEGKIRQKGERRKPKIPDLSLPHISHLTSTTDGEHAIAITAEDKAVRVFKISRSGRLHQLSSRVMPKKSCALTLTHDETTILTADKFGDVYALPLHPTAEYKQKQIKDSVSSFKPSATPLTVHTKGNREALRQQQMQKQINKKRDGPDFEHKLLLGHVSLLTDLAVARGNANGKIRRFIITSDRDEHIRVSRGIPQTHIIHTFCLGHQEFVSKLCIVPWDEEILIAGNGEPSLRVYNWTSGQEIARHDLREMFRQELEACLPTDRSVDKLSVSGIWPVAYQEQKGVLVALEGIPLLFSFSFHAGQLHPVETLSFEGNILDIADLPDLNSVAISMDNAHLPGSTREYRTPESNHVASIQIVQKKEKQLPDEQVCIGLEISERVYKDLEDLSISSLLKKRDAGYSQDKSEDKTYSVLGEFLYGLENLRKRRGNTFEKDDDDVEVAEEDQE